MPDTKLCHRIPKTFPVWLLSMLIVTAPCHGDSGTGEHWLDEMARIDLQIQLIQKRAQLQRMLEESVADMNGSLPRVVAIMGADNALRAQIRYSDGRQILGRAGDYLTPELRITRVTEREVMVVTATGSRSTAPFSLPFIADLHPASQEGTWESSSAGQSRPPAALVPQPPAINRAPAPSTISASPE